jgi:hypothetical protein
VLFRSASTNCAAACSRWVSGRLGKPGTGKTNKFFCFDSPSSVQHIPKLVTGSNFVDPLTNVDVFAVAKIHIALFVAVTPCTLFGTDILDVHTAPIFMNLRRYENPKSDRCL